MARKAVVKSADPIPREELEQYLLSNHRYFTMSEMAETTGYTYILIKRACDELGLEPITIGERVKQFVETHMHLTLQEQADKLGLKVDGLKHHYKQFGMNIKDAGKVPKVKSKKSLRSFGSMPLEMALGPIARKYNIEANPLEVINTARMKILST